MSSKIQKISVAELQELRKDSSKVMVIDVRETDEFRSSFIAQAINIPLSHFTKSHLPHLDEHKKLVLHCQGGLRSAMACEKIAEWVDEEIYDLEGGMDAWVKAGGEIQGKNKKGNGVSVMRQVHIIAGGLGLAGSVLAYTSGNMDWAILPAFIGAGLLFAGLTGFCGMAKMLTYMPWNK